MLFVAAEKITKRLKEIESFVETANTLTADVSRSNGDESMGGGSVGGNVEEPVAGETSAVKVEQ